MWHERGRMRVEMSGRWRCVASVTAWALGFLTIGQPLAEAITLTSTNEQHADGDSQTSAKGTVAIGSDGTNLQFISTDTSGEVQVDVKTLPALSAGTNNIGDVDVLTLPNVTIGAALPAGTNNIGDVDILSIAAGDNNIGNVDIVTLPNVTIGAALPAGTNNIGDVDVLTLPALPAGTNNIGDVDLISQVGTVNAANSSTATLTSGATFTGTGVSTLGYGTATVTAFADVASAAGGLKLDQSSDNSNWDIVDTATVSAGAGYQITVPLTAEFFRVRYVNGGTNQTAFRLETILKPFGTGAVTQTAPASLKTQVFGDDTTQAVDVDASGQLQVDVLTLPALAAGTNAIGKLAANSGVDIGDVDVTSIAAGNNNIGDVDVASIAAGDNNIGNVDVVTLPNVTIGAALPAGTNAIGKLAANSGVDIGDVDVTSIAAGNNNIGDVDVATLPALATGSNTIGKVNINALTGALASAAVSVATTETALPASALAGRTSIAVYNNGSATVFLGPTGVTTTTGFPLKAGQKISMDIDDTVPLFGIVSSGTVNVRVLEAN